MAHDYDIIIDNGAGIPGRGRDFIDDLNTTEKCFISILMKIVQLPGSKGYDNHTEVHTTTQKGEVCLAK